VPERQHETQESQRTSIPARRPESAPVAVAMGLRNPSSIKGMSPSEIRSLQRTVGNAAVARMFAVSRVTPATGQAVEPSQQLATIGKRQIDSLKLQIARVKATVDPDRLEKAEKQREEFQARTQTRVDEQVNRLEGQIERVRESYGIPEGSGEPAPAVTTPAAQPLVGGKPAVPKRPKPPKLPKSN
jgi:hypothetical protein